MMSMPWRRLILTLSALRAWAATRLPRDSATSQTAATSSSFITVISALAKGTNSSPEGLIFSVSTPSRHISRAVWRNWSGPSQTMAKVHLSR